ncbi:PIN domain-containing protein [Methylobacterium currus]|uniref:PIN domain-containing protein n=1 Tax=Methylobacterium currus TaxID=2051553 RepID=A0A2R4WJJ1_9HYPH|nr:PIN domain-containing protein [Methylobacterium currus]AWB21714.1 PIN domain-containing protein [Methylobacterium currus]
MFASRFTAFIDACALAGALKRIRLLTLAEAEFFRVRWSEPVLQETERTTAEILTGKGVADATTHAMRARAKMEAAFAEATVTGFADLLVPGEGLPDQNDAHVLAAAIKTRASVVVTDNLKDFPVKILPPLDLEARSTDASLADTIALDPGRATAAVRTMRLRFKRPEKHAEALLVDMGAAGRVETVDVLRPYAAVL